MAGMEQGKQVCTDVKPVKHRAECMIAAQSVNGVRPHSSCRGADNRNNHTEDSCFCIGISVLECLSKIVDLSAVM